jgi:two-component system NtrC family sensor kinase
MSTIEQMRALPDLPNDATATVSPIRVLIIDDNAAIHEDITKVLRESGDADSQLAALQGELFNEPQPVSYGGYEFASAYQGEEGLKLLEGAMASERPFAIAIVDVRMPPGWDGIETVTRLWEADPDLQVVICTAFSDYSWADIMARLSPGDGLLIVRKPFDAMEIRQITYTLATKWRLHRANRRKLDDLQSLVAERTHAWIEANREMRRRKKDGARMEVELRLAHKLEAVGQVASGIAYELNTPVQLVADSVHFVQSASNEITNLVSGYRALVRQLAVDRPEVLEEIKKLEEGADLAYLAEELPRACHRIAEGTSRVAAVVRTMKQFAHPEEHEKVFTDLNVALESTLRNARHEYKYVAEAVTDWGDVPPVLCDVMELNQVFLNLVVNAAQAIKAKPRAHDALGKITVRTRRDGDYAVITISDTGCGIPEDIRDRIYDPFFTTKNAARSTGQGLATARATVVEKHQGTISFETSPGKGTTFTIRLPIRGATQESASR